MNNDVVLIQAKILCLTVENPLDQKSSIKSYLSEAFCLDADVASKLSEGFKCEAYLNGCFPASVPLWCKAVCCAIRRPLKRRN